MNFSDFLIAPKEISTESWQLGSLISNEIRENGIVLLFVSDFRGAGGSSENLDFTPIRNQLYQLSKLDFEVPICDLGDLISGKTAQDTYYILQEVLTHCLQKRAIPIVFGGSVDLSYAIFSALNFFKKNINYTHISNVVSLQNDEREISEKNYLSRIFSNKDFSIENFHLLAYQKHLNEVDSVKLIEKMNFDIIRLAEMMGATEKIEPFFRKADLVTLNCDAIESFSDAFSVNPQVNGLNRREICAYMKEVGLIENLKLVGIFNANIRSKKPLNHQLMAQMLWYFIEGVNIQLTHPKNTKYETFYVMIGDQNYAFQRELFSNLWYFGADEKIENCIPCCREDFENAKKGILNKRFLR